MYKVLEKDAFRSVSKHQISLIYKHDKRVENKEQKKNINTRIFKQVLYHDNNH